MYESIYKNNELENEVSLDMSYFWYSALRASGKQNWFSFVVIDSIAFATSWTVACRAYRICATFTCVA